MDQFDLHTIKAVDLLAIASGDTTLRETAHNFFSGPCPFCGGEDRFVLKHDRGGNYLWFCRNCGNGKYGDAIDYIMRRDGLTFVKAVETLGGGSIRGMDPAVIAERERLAAEDRERRVAELAKHLSKFTNEEIWEAYHRKMNADNRAWWRESGVPDDWQDFWKLGYLPEKRFQFGEDILVSPAYTIPKFGVNWNPLNIDYRLMNPPKPSDKYRPAPGLPAAPFLSRPDLLEITDEVYILEGSKKAMVYAVASGTPVDRSVFGIPSKNSWAGIVQTVKNCGRIWVILDPDAFEWAGKLAVEIGKQARVIRLPFKADDGILKYGMTATRWDAAKKWAVKAEDIRL